MLDDIDVALLHECFMENMGDREIMDAYGFSLEEISFAEKTFRAPEYTPCFRFN